MHQVPLSHPLGAPTFMSAEVRRETFVADMNVGAPSGLPEVLNGVQRTSDILLKKPVLAGDSSGSAAVPAAGGRLPTA
ncbi:MAG: hypothetical protein ACAI34_22940 [Verrucomicrobium sp.]|nr:hypothetical protein [Verrucomicrobium sp.]